MPISGENEKFTLTRCDTNEDWLAQRKLGIGGSDVAALMGLSPWKTPAQLFLEKTGRVEAEDLSDKPYVAFGNLMEPLIGDWYKIQYPKRTVRRVNAICKSIERPWAQASLDYEVKDGLVWGVLEIKTARSAKEWEEGVPLYYLTQITHYMQVTNRPFADVAVFFRDTCEFACYRVEYDPTDGDVVRESVDEFWNDYVCKGVMPELVGTAGEVSDLLSAHGTAVSDFKTTTDQEAIDAISAYQLAAEREKQAKADKTKATAVLAKAIGEAKGIVTDVARVTWVRSVQKRFDAKRFAQECPDLYEQYTTEYVRNGGLRIKEL